VSPARHPGTPLVEVEIVRGGTPDAATTEAIRIAATRLLAARRTEQTPATIPAWSRAGRIEATTGTRLRTLSALRAIRDA